MGSENLLRVWLPLAGGLCALTFLFLKWPGANDWMRWLGLALSLIGLGGVILARYTLGRSFSIKAKATELMTSGIYSRIRNPIYISGFFFIGGIILIVRKPMLLLLLLILIPVQVMRARREAQVLVAKFGDAYRAYRARTWF